MKSDIIAITDHIKDFSIEKEILGKYLEDKLSKRTTIILVWHKQIDKVFLDKYPAIRAVVRYGVGYDNIDIDYCKKKNIIVANTPDYGIDEVADSALAMILYLTRKIGSLEDLAKADSNYWLGKKFNLNMRRLNKLSLGIIGLGRIGSSISKKFSVFSRNISFYDPYKSNGYEKVYGINRHRNLLDLLKESDIITINTPLTKETKGLVNKEFLNQMKKGSYLINLSRGPILENKDLILEKLLSKHLEGYGTDVWTNEPPLKDDQLYDAWKQNHEDLKGRIIVNPHTAYYSKEALLESRNKACSTCLDIINKRYINNRIV
tara:strand:- start:1519 stop:2475 length:957 start_codon:yes stop_codon:yes gene_type:complete